jgi:hypothetical protein
MKNVSGFLLFILFQYFYYKNIRIIKDVFRVFYYFDINIDIQHCIEINYQTTRQNIIF